MKTLPIQEFYKALAINERDVKKFRHLALNTVQIIFRDGHDAMFILNPRVIIKNN